MENSASMHQKFLQNIYATCKLFKNFKEVHKTQKNMLKNFEKKIWNFY